MDTALSALEDPETLRALLGKAIGSRRVRRAIVGISTDDLSASAVAGAGVFAATQHRCRIRAGCLIKLVTAALVLDTATAGALSLDSPVVSYLPPMGSASKLLETISIRHLLEHTHGLDDSLMELHHFTASGRIDLEFIRDYVSRMTPLNAPGEAYSYSHVGSLLLAAVLEQQLGESFGNIVVSSITAPLDISLGRDAGRSRTIGRPISPAFDDELSLSPEDLMRLLRHCARSLLQQQRVITCLPGWSPLERGICLGWKVYGDNWYGHASDAPEHLTIAKVQPDSGIVVLASSDHAPSSIMATVFAQLLPRSHDLRFPRLLSTQERSALDPDSYLGAFGNAALTASITSTGSRALMITLSCPRNRSVADHEIVTSRALPARDNVFVCERAAGDYGVFQLLGLEGTGFRWLWNGKTLLRRLSAVPAAQPRSLDRQQGSL